MKIGDRIYVELPYGGFEAELLAGYSTSIGAWTEEPGQTIGCDAQVLMLDTDNNERLMVNGWMITFADMAPAC